MELSNSLLTLLYLGSEKRNSRIVLIYGTHSCRDLVLRHFGLCCCERLYVCSWKILLWCKIPVSNVTTAYKHRYQFFCALWLKTKKTNTKEPVLVQDASQIDFQHGNKNRNVWQIQNDNPLNIFNFFTTKFSFGVTHVSLIALKLDYWSTWHRRIQLVSGETLLPEKNSTKCNSNPGLCK